MKKHLLIWLISAACLSISISTLADISILEKSAFNAPPPIDANLSKETQVKSIAYERHLFTLDHQQLRLLDGLANSNPYTARVIISGIKTELNYLEFRKSGQSFSDFLSNVPLERRTKAIQKSFNSAWSVLPEYPPEDATGVTKLELVKRFKDSPFAHFRYFLPDEKIDEETLQRLKLPKDNYLQYFRDNPGQRRLLAQRLAVLDNVRNGEAITRNELRLLPHRFSARFMKDDVDDVLDAIGATSVLGDPINNDLESLKVLFSDLNTQVEGLKKEYDELGLEKESAELLESFDKSKQAYLNADDENIRAEAHRQMLNTLNIHYTKLIYRAALNGPGTGRNEELWDQVAFTEYKSSRYKFPVPKDFGRIKIGNVDLSDWSDETWAQSLKLASNFTMVFRNIAVVAGDDETALKIQGVATGIELISQMYRGYSLAKDAYSVMSDASDPSMELKSMASLLGGAGLVLGAFVALDSMSQSTGGAQQFERLSELIMQVAKIARANLYQSQQNKTYILSVSAQIRDLESRMIEQMAFLREGQNAIRGDISDSLAWEFTRHFKEAERDAKAYIREKTLRDELNSDRTKLGQISEQRGADSSAAILAFMLKDQIEHPIAGTIKPAQPNISDFIEDGVYGFSWRSLNNLFPQDFLRAFHKQPTRTKLNYLFGADGLLKESTDLNSISEAFDNLYYPVSLTGPMETIEELAKYSNLSETTVLAYEATVERAKSFLNAQEELRRPLVSAAFERLDAFRRLERAYANLMIASLSSVSSQFGIFSQHNVYVSDLIPAYRRLGTIFERVRALDNYGVEQLSQGAHEFNTSYLDWEINQAPRKALRNGLSSEYSGGHGIRKIGEGIVKSMGELDSGYSVGGVFALHRAEKLGLVETVDVNKDQEGAVKFPFVDMTGRKWIRPLGAIPFTFEGWVPKTEPDPGFLSPLAGIKRTKWVKGDAKGTLYYSRVVHYLSEDIPLADDFALTRDIEGFTIPSSRKKGQGVLGYEFKAVLAQKWNSPNFSLKSGDGKSYGLYHKYNVENQALAEAVLKSAQAMEEVWTRVVAQVMRDRANDKRPDMPLWFEGMLGAARDARLYSTLNASQTEKTFGIFFKDNIFYPPTPGVTEIRNGKVWEGGYDYAFKDGREFVENNFVEVQEAIRDIEALNWYIAYALAASYGDCIYTSQALFKDVALTLPQYIEDPGSVIASHEDIYLVVPRQLPRDISSAYKSMEIFENLELLVEDGLLPCDPTHRIAPTLNALESTFKDLENFGIAQELGTVFPISDLNDEYVGMY